MSMNVPQAPGKSDSYKYYYLLPNSGYTQTLHAWHTPDHIF